MNIADKHASLKTALETTISCLKDQKPLVEDILSRLLIDSLKKYQEKVKVGAEDSVIDILDTFKQKLLSDLFDISQHWLVSSDREKILFPTNCRFLYTVGNSTIAVIEEPCMLRTLTLDNALLLEDRAKSARVTSRHCLPLPYVVFVIHFIKNNLSALYVTWRNGPLQSLQDKLYEPILPNMHAGCSVCMGHQFRPIGDNISQVVDHTITTFWESAFNTDLGEFWWEKSSIDKRLTNVNTWKELIPMDMLGLKYKEAYPSLENLLNTCVQAHDEVDETVLLRKHLTNSVDKCSQQMFEKVMKYFRRTKFEKYHPKEIVTGLGDVISNISNDIIDLVKFLEIELNELSEEIDESYKDVKHFGWKPVGNQWIPYEENNNA